ncbi:MAG: peptide chain release factor N(5)-glutamine methyltransferase [Muribaculaceae bacterium]|nr:peptide chain release factor N(5)-glutamine methyltransferase [Muribaculaceae bacterium]
MTLNDLRKCLTALLEDVLGRDEAEVTARILMEDTLSLSMTQMVLDGTRELEEISVERLMEMGRRVADGTPVQYVTGKARFIGNDYEVNEATLIPRPETAGLVDLVTDYAGPRTDLRVLDVGTGSGIIAISLARALKFPVVEAIDVSEDALKVAASNARRLNTSVAMTHGDIFTLTPVPEIYDIIVSNPPYIPGEEADEMEARVLLHEPHYALFVPDSDPLMFYRAIGRYAQVALKPGGALFFEINPRFAAELEQMLQHMGFSEISVMRDYLGRLRYCKAVKP